MTLNPPPPGSDESDSESVFDDFINRNLDLDGLEADQDEDESGEVTGAGLQFHSDGQGRIFLEFPGPGSVPPARIVTEDPQSGASLGGLRMPFEHDARWMQVVMRGQPRKLRIHRARVSFNNYNGQVILSLPARASRLIWVIPEIKPGWTAVRYTPGCETPAELFEWQGNRAVMHKLKVGPLPIYGYIRDEEMPATRPVRHWERIADTIDFAEVLIFFGGLLVVLIAALLFVSARLPQGDGPATVELQNQVSALQEQVATLEAAFEGRAPQDGR